MVGKDSSTKGLKDFFLKFDHPQIDLVSKPHDALLVQINTTNFKTDVRYKGLPQETVNTYHSNKFQIVYLFVAGESFQEARRKTGLTLTD